MAAYGNPDPKRNVQWNGTSFHRRLKLAKVPVRLFVQDAPVFQALVKLLEESEIAVAKWEAL